MEALIWLIISLNLFRDALFKREKTREIVGEIKPDGRSTNEPDKQVVQEKGILASP